MELATNNTNNTNALLHIIREIRVIRGWFFILSNSEFP
jgi:hypothetical protein